MIWWALGIYLIIFLLVVPIKLQMVIDFDLFNNDGGIKFFLWGKKILYEECKINGKVLIFKNKSKTNIIDINKFGQNDFKDRFFFNLTKMIKINTIKSESIIGLKDESFYTNIFAGYLLCAQATLLAFLSTKKKIKILKLLVAQTNLDNKVYFKISSSISLCLLQVVSSLIFALFKIQKGVSYGKQSN